MLALHGMTAGTGPGLVVFSTCIAPVNFPIRLLPRHALMLYIPINFSTFCMEEKNMGSEGGGGVYGFGLWEMKFLNIPYLFAGFVLLRRCLPATCCTAYYGLKRMKEEQGLVIQQKKKLGMQQGSNPSLQGERPAPKPLNHEDSYILRVSFFYLAELATSEF